MIETDYVGVDVWVPYVPGVCPIDESLGLRIVEG